MRLTSTATAVSIATAPVARHLWKFAAMSSDLVTVAGMARLMGMDDAWIGRWGSAVGRKVAGMFRKANGTDPRKAWELSARGLKRNMAYMQGTEAQVIAGVILDYMVKTEIHKTAMEAA